MAEKLVPLKVNAEKDWATADKYGVSAYPTIVFADASGKEIGRIERFQSGPDFAETISEMLAKAPEA